MKKYRAWHEGNKSFSYFTLAEMWKNGFHVAQSTEYGNKDDIKRGSDGLYATEEFFESEFMGNTFCLNVADWEQFTGLHDKKGMEIYKGDIVKKIKNAGTAYHDEGDVEVVLINPQGVFPCGAYDGDCGDKEEGEFWEIIGNVKENPEPLEAKP